MTDTPDRSSAATLPALIADRAEPRGTAGDGAWPSPGGWLADSADAEERDLMELFAEQTRLHRRGSRRRARIIARFLQDPATIRHAGLADAAAPGGRRIPLPRGPLPPVTAEQLFARRRSAPRDAVGAALDIRTLGVLLQHAAANQRVVRARAAPDVAVARRAYPSAGALFPVAIHVWSGAVEGLVAKPYVYDPHRHELADHGAIPACFTSVEPQGPMATDTPPAAAILLTCRTETLRRKYGLRALRLAWLEAGHLGQALAMAAAALDLPSLVYASFHDAEVDRALMLDGLSETVVSAVLVGGRPS